MTGNNINEIVSYVFSSNTIYDEIIDTVIGKYRNKKPELISVLALYFLENPKKIINIYNTKYFEYWFIRVVKNQLYSNSSYFQKDTKIQETYFDEIMKFKDIEDTMDDYEIKEKQFKLLRQAMNSINCSWFEGQIFELYYKDGLSFRQIEKEVGIDHCLAYKTVESLREKMRDYIAKNKKE